MADFSIKIDPDQIATIIWDCPQKPVNVLNFEAIKLLDSLVDKILLDEDIIGAVITSAKPDFAAGMDLKVLADLRKRKASTGRKLVEGPDGKFVWTEFTGQDRRPANNGSKGNRER